MYKTKPIGLQLDELTITGINYVFRVKMPKDEKLCMKNKWFLWSDVCNFIEEENPSRKVKTIKAGRTGFAMKFKTSLSALDKQSRKRWFVDLTGLNFILCGSGKKNARILYESIAAIIDGENNKDNQEIIKNTLDQKIEDIKASNKLINPGMDQLTIEQAEELKKEIEANRIELEMYRSELPDIRDRIKFFNEHIKTPKSQASRDVTITGMSNKFNKFYLELLEHKVEKYEALISGPKKFKTSLTMLQATEIIMPTGRSYEDLVMCLEGFWYIQRVRKNCSINATSFRLTPFGRKFATIKNGELFFPVDIFIDMKIAHCDKNTGELQTNIRKDFNSGSYIDIPKTIVDYFKK